MVTGVDPRQRIFPDGTPLFSGAGTTLLLFDGGVRQPRGFGSRFVNLSSEFVQARPEACADQHGQRGGTLCAGDGGVAPGAKVLSVAYQPVFPDGYLACVQDIAKAHGKVDVTAHAYSAAPKPALLLEGAAEFSRLVEGDHPWSSTVLAAAGHMGAEGVRFPAVCRSVLAIGVCDEQGRPTAYCSVSPELRKPELLVREGSYATADESGRQATLGGTSAAVNLAAGVASLWCERLRAQGIEPLSCIVRAALLASSEAAAVPEHRLLSARALCDAASVVFAEARPVARDEAQLFELRASEGGAVSVCVVLDQRESNQRFQDAPAQVRLSLSCGGRRIEVEASLWARAELECPPGELVACRVEVSGRTERLGIVAMNARQERATRAPAAIRTGRIVVGIGASHDAGACVLRDGKLVRAVQLERLSRIKHDGSSLLNSRAALDYCLQSLGLRAADVDLFCFNLQSVLPGYAGLSQPVAAADFDLFDPFGERALFVSHHLAHAYAAFFCSPFDRAGVFIADGSGGSTVGEPDLILPGPAFRRYLEQPLRSRPALHVQSGYAFDEAGFRLVTREEAPSFNVRCGSSSLGEAYAAVSQYVFGDWQASGKLMGLAPYGNADQFGPSTLVRDAQGLLQFGADWKLGLNQLSKKEDPLQFADLAARIQTDFETALLERLRHFLAQAESPRLAYAGGLALNSVANDKIAGLVGPENFYVMPASSDSGIAIGAAAAGEQHLTGSTAHSALGHDYLGHPYGQRDCDLAIAAVADAVSAAPAATEEIADALVHGHVVGWFEGAAEFGPRALGHRSILADPRKKEMWLHINRRIKFREDFRPFAPMVPRELAGEFFELDGESPYMLRVVRVRPQFRHLLGAVTHVDGSARVQTVDAAVAPRIHELLLAFGKRSGVPVLLNTSLNVRGEPVVETPQEALEMLLCTHLDALVLGSRWVRRRQLRVDESSQIRLAPKTSVHAGSERGQPSYQLCAKARGNKTYPLDAPTFAVLAHATGGESVGTLCSAQAATADRAKLLQRLNALATLGLVLPLTTESLHSAATAPNVQPQVLVADIDPLTASTRDTAAVDERLRRASVQQTLARVSSRLNVLGVTRVADLTDFDRVGIPVFGATRPRVDAAQITATQGKGLTTEEARVSALMEAVERHAAATARPVRTASVSELLARGESVVGPQMLGIEFSLHDRLEWLQTRALRSGRPAFIPAAEVLFPYHAPAGLLRPVRPSTTGLSAGNTLGEAALQALGEVAERAAVSRYRRGEPVPLVDASALAGSVEGLLLERFERAGVRVAIFDLSGLGPLPCYFVSAASLDNLGAPVAAAGQGASLNPRLALRRALLEAAQSRVVALQGSREDLVRHAAAWAVDERAAHALWEAARDRAARTGLVAPPEAVHIPSVADGLTRTIERLSLGSEADVFVTDLTHPEVGIPVVHAFVPGLYDGVVEAERGARVRA
ncbi:MAG TPA: carbamoyltransferase C-terminal domain-containing protein [Polyangiaceae bacterium]|nr:carbamoyltransferase C-terminal domain-containing protein [Polyangiaceae bacterium]